jgi:plastocyanin
MRRSGTIVWAGIAATLALGAGACGSEPQTQPQGPLAIEKAPSKDGDEQTQVAGETLSSPLRVLVTRNDVAVPGSSVRWTTDDGSFDDATTVADANGIASGVWTLSDEVGDQTAQASIQGADGSPLTFTAHAITQPGGGGGGETTVVTVSGPPLNQFNPSTVTITAGETVIWRWAGGAVGHNVRPDDGNVPTGELDLFDAPHSYSYTFTEPGTYTYHCAAHGPAMSGTVIVEPGT